VVAAIVVAVAFGVHACAGGASPVEVLVNGRAVMIPPRGRVRDALRAAHLRRHDGALRAVTRATLAAHWRRARVFLDGRRVSPRARVRAGDRIRLINGTNAVESTEERDIAVPSPGGTLPDVERELWIPPTNGLVRQTLGARSGQLVSQLALRPAAPASPLPGRVIALSFDDGPDPTFTPPVLQILATAGVRATFCLIGRQARAYPDLVRAIAAQGDNLCDHTETHPHLGRLPADQIDTQITPPAQFIQTVTGQAPAFQRPPWGDVNPTVIAIAHQRGLRRPGWAAVRTRATRTAGEGAVGQGRAPAPRRISPRRTPRRHTEPWRPREGPRGRRRTVTGSHARSKSASGWCP
jgi:peptidoglycan/xylan/chitin deacetylase (PgdA/CDA1 family)